MILKSCPVCGCEEMIEVPKLGVKCQNCDEIFAPDERYGITTVSLAEWLAYLNTQESDNSLRSVIKE